MYYDLNGDGSFTGNEVIDPYDWTANYADPWVADRGGPPSEWLWDSRQTARADLAPGSGATAVLDDLVAQVAIVDSALHAPASLVLRSTNSAASVDAAAHTRVTRVAAENTIAVGDTFELAGQWDAGGTLTDFEASVPVTVTYSEAQAAEVIEASIGLYRWDDTMGNWVPLDGSVNTVANQAYATTTQAGTFCLRATPLYVAPALSEAGLASEVDGYVLTLNGTGMRAGARVYLESFALEVLTVNADAVQAWVPATFAPGIYDVMLRNPDGQSATLAGAVRVGHAVYLPLVQR